MMHEWSTMKRLIYLRGNPATGGGGGSPLTVSGPTPLLMPGALAKPMRAATFQISPVQSGSGDPSPSNVRPITGWTGCTAWVTGKNLWPIAEITASGYYNKLSEQTYPEIWSMARALIPGQKYRIAADISIQFAIDYSDGTTVTIRTASQTNDVKALVGGLTISNIFLYVGSSSDQGSRTAKDIVLSHGTTAEAYTPYSGTTVSVEFPASVGTVYSGTIDPVTGEGVVTHKKIVLADTLDIKQYIQTADGWSYALRSLRINELKIGVFYTDYLSTNYTPVGLSGISSSATAWKICCYSAAGNQFILVTSTETTVEGFRNELTANGAYVVVPIETPIPFTIPPQSLTPPAGDAYIWADCGGSAEVTYIGKA